MVINFIVIANSFLNYIFMLHMHIHIYIENFFLKEELILYLPILVLNMSKNELKLGS